MRFKVACGAAVDDRAGLRVVDHLLQGEGAADPAPGELFAAFGAARRNLDLFFCGPRSRSAARGAGAWQVEGRTRLPRTGVPAPAGAGLR